MDATAGSADDRTILRRDEPDIVAGWHVRISIPAVVIRLWRVDARSQLNQGENQTGCPPCGCAHDVCSISCRPRSPSCLRVQHPIFSAGEPISRIRSIRCGWVCQCYPGMPGSVVEHLAALIVYVRPRQEARLVVRCSEAVRSFTRRQSARQHRNCHGRTSCANHGVGGTSRGSSRCAAA